MNTSNLFRNILSKMEGKADREDVDPDQSEESFDDTRVEFLANYVTRSLKLSDSKWKKMEEVEENKRLVLE